MDNKLDALLKGKIDETYVSELQKLNKNIIIYPEEYIQKLDEISKKIWSNYNTVYSLKRPNPEILTEIEEKSLNYLEHFAQINERMGKISEKIKYKSEEQYALSKNFIAEKYIIAFQHYFKILQKRRIKSNLEFEELKRVVSSNKSPYYHIKELIIKVKVIYDKIGLFYYSKNNFEKAHDYYFLLAEIIIKEISYAEKIYDRFLYSEEDIGLLYFNAGRVVFRCYSIINNKYFTIYHGTPVMHCLISDIQTVFNLDNQSPTLPELAIMSFEKSKDILKKTGNKIYYLKCKDYLYKLKSKNNDFENNWTEIFYEISKNFTANKNIITNHIKDPKKIKEEDIRDYFLSHIKLMIENVAVAENTKTIGYSDITIFGKDNYKRIHEAVCEFKVWGRNSSGKHSYKNVINQLKGYMTDFESFGIIIMINPNKSSIKNKYINMIIKKDKSYIKNSLDEDYEPSGVIFKSKHNNKSNIKQITIYHVLLNIFPLFNVSTK